MPEQSKLQEQLNQNMVSQIADIKKECKQQTIKFDAEIKEVRDEIKEINSDISRRNERQIEQMHQMEKMITNVFDTKLDEKLVPFMDKLNETIDMQKVLENRVTNLEHKDAQKALMRSEEKYRLIRTAIISGLASFFLAMILDILFV